MWTMSACFLLAGAAVAYTGHVNADNAQSAEKVCCGHCDKSGTCDGSCGCMDK